MKISIWPNQLGAEVNSGSAVFSVFFPAYFGAHCEEYKATRIVGGVGIAYRDGIKAASTAEAAELIVKDWRNNRAAWNPFDQTIEYQRGFDAQGKKNNPRGHYETDGTGNSWYVDEETGLSCRA